MLTKSEMISIMNHAVQKIEESGPNEIADDLKEVIYQLEDEWSEELEAEDTEESGFSEETEFYDNMGNWDPIKHEED